MGTRTLPFSHVHAAHPMPGMDGALTTVEFQQRAAHQIWNLMLQASTEQPEGHTAAVAALQAEHASALQRLREHHAAEQADLRRLHEAELHSQAAAGEAAHQAQAAQHLGEAASASAAQAEAAQRTAELHQEQMAAAELWHQQVRTAPSQRVVCGGC